MIWTRARCLFRTHLLSWTIHSLGKRSRKGHCFWYILYTGSYQRFKAPKNTSKPTSTPSSTTTPKALMSSIHYVASMRLYILVRRSLLIILGSMKRILIRVWRGRRGLWERSWGSRDWLKRIRRWGGLCLMAKWGKWMSSRSWKSRQGWKGKTRKVKRLYLKQHQHYRENSLPTLHNSPNNNPVTNPHHLPQINPQPSKTPPISPHPNNPPQPNNPPLTLPSTNPNKNHKNTSSCCRKRWLSNRVKSILRAFHVRFMTRSYCRAGYSSPIGGYVSTRSSTRRPYSLVARLLTSPERISLRLRKGIMPWCLTIVLQLLRLMERCSLRHSFPGIRHLTWLIGHWILTLRNSFLSPRRRWRMMGRWKRRRSRRLWSRRMIWKKGTRWAGNKRLISYLKPFLINYFIKVSFKSPK